MNLLDTNTLDFNSLDFISPEKIKGSFISLVKYKGEDIYVKTPLFKYSEDIIKTESKTFLNLEFDETNISFYEFLCNLDEFAVKKIHENSLEWFNKEFPLDVIEDFFVSILKHKQMPKIKIHISSGSKNLEYTLTDRNDNKIDSLKNNEKVSVILKFTGLKFLKQKVISEWNVVKIISDFESYENLITDNIDLEIENYLNSSDNEDDDSLSEDDNKSEDNYDLNENENEKQNKNENQSENKVELIDNMVNNTENLMDENEPINILNKTDNNDILEMTQQELNKYKILFKENEIKYNELKNNIKKCLDL